MKTKVLLGFVLSAVMLIAATCGSAPDEIVVEGTNPTKSPTSATVPNGAQATLDPTLASLQATVAAQKAALDANATAMAPQQRVTPTAPAIVQTAVPTTTVEYKLGWDVAWYQSPFVGFTKPQLADKATHETLGEPGVLLNNEAAFDHLTAVLTPLLVPEGGYTYVAVGSLTIGNVEFKYAARNIYLFLFRGIPSDGKPETDLNKVVNVSGYTPGTGIFDIMPAGAYVSQNWFIDQIKNADRSPNCGEGCLTTTVVVFDLKTSTYRQWSTIPSTPTIWVRK